MSFSTVLKFGLNVPATTLKKPKTAIRKNQIIFENSADEASEESETLNLSATSELKLKPPTSILATASSARIETIQRKALDEDPLVFDYDATMAQLDGKKRSNLSSTSSDHNKKVQIELRFALNLKF